MDFTKPYIEKLVYPLMRIRRGNQVLRYLKELKASEALPSGRLASLQREKLERLMDACVRRTSAYRIDDGKDDGTLPGRWKTVNLLTRDIFRSHPEDYLARGVRRDDLIPAASGGSTDAPIKFFLDRFAVEHYEAARWRGLSWWGISPGSRSVMLWGSPVELSQAAQKAYRQKEKRLKNRVIISAHDLSEADLPQHLSFINRYRPEYFYGYATALYTFAQLMESGGLKLSFRPKAVVSTAETLFEFQREVIGRAFGCPVVNEYGAKDAGILAYECPSGGMHISCENVLIEVLHPVTFKPVPIGEKGMLVTTDLNNLSMPRLRYILGDLASLSADSCPCGRTLPLLGGLEGRLVDMLVARDGPRGDKFVHCNALVRMAKSFPGVLRFQVVQHTLDKATLYLVPVAEGQDRELDGFTESARMFLPGVDITPRIVDDIPSMASGKHRYAIREFPLTQAKIPQVRSDDDETGPEGGEDQ